MCAKEKSSIGATRISCTPLSARKSCLELRKLISSGFDFRERYYGTELVLGAIKSDDMGTHNGHGYQRSIPREMEREPLDCAILYPCVRKREWG